MALIDETAVNLLQSKEFAFIAPNIPPVFLEMENWGIDRSLVLNNRSWKISWICCANPTYSPAARVKIKVLSVKIQTEYLSDIVGQAVIMMLTDYQQAFA
ncbi:MAG: hypothetical protein AB1403_24120 [Candidatus Riflebacteria bacterium]